MTTECGILIFIKNPLMDSPISDDSKRIQNKACVDHLCRQLYLDHIKYNICLFFEYSSKPSGENELLKNMHGFHATQSRY